MGKQWLVLLFGMIVCLGLTRQAYAQYDFDQASVLEIIQEIEDNEAYRFLYRESQLTGISLSFSATSATIIDSLRTHLYDVNIAIEADTSRKQIILYQQTTSSSQKLSVTGQVVDARTGERLPYATIFYEINGRKQGVAANASGVFNIKDAYSGRSVTLHCSFLGYENGRVKLSMDEQTAFRDLTFRLQPVALQSNDIIVTGFTYPAGSDSIYRNFVNAGVLNPLGENNTTKALQALPAVTNGTALNNGINVRGSSADATHILLDGITIYNQSHLFGLLDSFNPNALQTSGFFYDVTPAQFQSSPGGTINMLTKTGSLNDFSASVGLSNTAFNATLQGPFSSGKSSWLLSGRTSYMNSLNWFRNDNLIAYGLNIDRPNNLSGDDVTDIDSRLVFPGSYDASFFDLHGKMYVEFENGSRLIAGAYYGADDVSQDAERLVRRFNPNTPSQRFSLEEVQTLNKWGNFSSSLAYKSPVSERIYSSSLAAVSIYNSEFSKDDFVYNRIQENGANIQVFTYPLQNQSVFNEIKLDQTFDLVLPNTQWTVGASYQHFMGEYFEESFDRPGFLTTFEAGLADLYAQLDFTSLDVIDVHFGSRLHYYNNGNYLYYSPRIKFKFLNERAISLGLGYSRNYQFTHRLSFYNISSPDVWIISTKEQPPTTSDYFTAGMYFRFLDNTLFQMEGYHKSLVNARLFDINAQTLTNSFNAPPWFYGNDGTAKGLEFLLKNRFQKLTLTHSYALSESTFRNPDIFDGEEFYTEWDRTHSFHSAVEYRIIPNLKTFLSLTLASGTPNRLHFLQIEEQERLGNYRRVDAGFEYKAELEGVVMEIGASVFNLFDHQNAWYRELDLVIDTSVPPSQRRLSSQAVNVYDLGIQPSFNLMVRF
ncbi:TonB-dependent receptor [Gracilimonas sediminicola]|uniref:TonB-dependent receptor n=1 Tax=Gracilimonas sediminicola TaxID=2952158 RepID=A0A9X2L167_9BACT|nr:TonB-dependent receptor [Gracilimonas sediminicola]MCP9290289.1 TonB-dependent receptor [Gracilimonas sediminicola]